MKNRNFFIGGWKFLPLLTGVIVLSAFLARTGNQTPTSAGEKPVVVRINAVAGLQYDRVRFSVRPGARVQVVFTNKDDMSHNMVFTRPGKRESVVAAGMKLEEKGPSMNYIPETPDVLWSIPVLSPGEEKSVTFTAPDEQGVYPYVCTFPGHGFVMYGAMYVAADGKMPDLREDENIPPARRKDRELAASGEPMHPYDPEPPYLYRAYMDDAGPAAIAVRLPRELAYCWDAETCELRYAWDGGFVDNTGLWKGKPNSEAKVLGTIFYRNTVKQPLRLRGQQTVSSVEFKGYRLMDRYPEFHYQLDGKDIYEIIRAADNGKGLVRSFRIPNADTDVWFVPDAKDGMKYTSTAGEWNKGRLHVPRSAAQKFSITMIKTEEGK